jgi:hypothetical protein
MAEQVARSRRQQYDLAVISLPPDLNAITEARIQAEDGACDATLLRMRELELAHLALPPIIDGVRRIRLLNTDPISTTWEGWSVSGGERVFLRCLRPRWHTDPVMIRRMSKGTTTAASWHPDGDWPHTRVVCDGALLADRFPVEDMASTSRLARLMGEGLGALAEVHHEGRVHGGPLAAFLVESKTGLKLVHLDAFDNTATVADDLKQLAQTILALDPSRADPVACLAEEWIAHPPPSAEDGIRLLKRCLSGVLLSERHRLSVAGRSANRMDRTARLARAIRQLAEATAPPVGKVCLRASNDGVLVIAESDGCTVRGGAAADISEGRFLPIIYTPTQGLDAQSARFLLRSWAMRSGGDETIRAEHQKHLGSSDSGADKLTRWLSAMARLRSARLILKAGQATL